MFLASLLSLLPAGMLVGRSWLLLPSFFFSLQCVERIT